MDPEHFEVLRKVQKKPNSTQRELAEELGLSVGKLNYCLRALKNKGLIKINNFKQNKQKERYLYLLTPKGVIEKTKITINFMKQKMKEYDELKKDFENEKNKSNKK